MLSETTRVEILKLAMEQNKFERNPEMRSNVASIYHEFVGLVDEADAPVEPAPLPDLGVDAAPAPRKYQKKP